MQTSAPKKNIHDAFTLIEIMIVIVIIGIIAGTVLAVINPQRQIMRSNEGVLKANMTKLCAGLLACMGSGKNYNTGRCDTGAEINSFGSTSIVQIENPSQTTYSLVTGGTSTSASGSMTVEGKLTHSASQSCTLRCTVINDFTNYDDSGTAREPGEIYKVGSGCINP